MTHTQLSLLALDFSIKVPVALSKTRNGLSRSQETIFYHVHLHKKLFLRHELLKISRWLLSWVGLKASPKRCLGMEVSPELGRPQAMDC